jgi:hypothetical protein
MADEVVLVHADAVIGDGQGLGLGLVGGEGHGKLAAAFQQLGLGERQIAQLVAGIGGVRYQLAQKDRFIAVERMGDDVQQPRHLGLKSMAFLRHDRGFSWGRKLNHSSAHMRRSGGRIKGAEGGVECAQRHHIPSPTVGEGRHSSARERVRVRGL